MAGTTHTSLVVKYILLGRGNLHTYALPDIYSDEVYIWNITYYIITLRGALLIERL